MTNGTTTDVAREPRARVTSVPMGSTESTTRVATLSQALGSPRPGGAAAPRPPARPRGGEPPRPEPVSAPAPPGPTGDAGTPPDAPNRAPATAEAADTVPPALARRTGRGRHRRPRPRRALLAVGGLALAAGALSLARMAPDGVTGIGGGAEAEPRPGVADDGALDASPTVWAAPSARPATAGAPARGGAGATPAAGASPGATASTGPSGATGPAGRAGATGPSATARPGARPPGGADAPVDDAPDTTGIPTAPVPSQPPAAPPPQPTPDATTHAPAPAPKPASPGLCVPIVGICVNSLTGPLAHG
ncbi:hypothetical protein ACFRDV_42625 [Streptomyces fagopyri]|uniref:hypothetical protein n=1 Tax=Streptomyces fagopyri TaxID=2662397 RepID=UPI0036771738